MARRAIDLSGYGLPYWLDIERPVYPLLKEHIRADAAIIGGGIAGLKIADYLAAHGLSSIVLEANRIGEGASSRNQGCIVTGLSVPYRELVEQTSRSVARSLVALSHYNQELLVEQIERHRIACDYEVLGETLLVRADLAGGEGALESLRRDATLLVEDGFEALYVSGPDACKRTGGSVFMGGIHFPEDAQFHSGKFVIGLGAAVARSRHVQVFEGSPALHIESGDRDHTVRTPCGAVSASHLFVATNALVPQLLPALTGSLRAERGQVMITEPLAARPCTGCFAAGTAWWREVREDDGSYRLLFGGGRRRDDPDTLLRQFASNGRPNQRLGTAGFQPTIVHQRRLEARFAEVFPHLSSARITHRWGGLQSFTFDGLPVIGLFDPERRIHGMAGFSGLGNSFSNVGAAYLADRAAGVRGEVEQRFATPIESLLVPGRESVRWPGGEPTLARSDTTLVRPTSASNP
jgi:gamma-glutamylputrescine oxidase